MTKAPEAMGHEGLIGLADKGDAHSAHLKGCEEKGMAISVPVPKASSRKGSGPRYVTAAFDDDGAKVPYVYPAGPKLRPKGSTALIADKRDLVDRASTKVCGGGPLTSRCRPSSLSRRPLFRWQDEDVVDRHRARMAAGGDVMHRRGALVAHPLGTLKRWAGLDYFLMRGLATCRAEMSLMVLGSTFKRMLNTLGGNAFMAYCQARKEVQGRGM